MPSIDSLSRTLLLESFYAAVAAANPLNIVSAHLPDAKTISQYRRIFVIGAGKAAASMAAAVEKHWPENLPIEGLVITRYGHAVPTQSIQVIEAGHPIPDASGEAAANKIFNGVKALGPEDLLIALFSGGGSSLLALPVAGISMHALRTATNALLRCGAPIQDINIVRKHLSLIQGGRLAAACRAPILNLLISDVAGNNPSHIASGPCCADASTYRNALDILKNFNVEVPKEVIIHLEHGASGEIAETPKPGNPLFEKVDTRIIATAQKSLYAAAAYFEMNGIRPIILGDDITGEATHVAQSQASLVKQIRNRTTPFEPPVALISGGECTVTVKGNGRGGRCAEFLLALAIELDGMPDTHALACDTDGIDGSEDNAGAVLTPDSLTRANLLGDSAKNRLANNDAYSFFEGLKDLVITGPTRTNVNDYRVILLR